VPVYRSFEAYGKIRNKAKRTNRQREGSENTYNEIKRELKTSSGAKKKLLFGNSSFKVS